VWVPPGEDDGDDDQAILALADVMGSFASRPFTIVDLMSAGHPRVPHEYLFFLGTRPRWQGRGIGSALMRPVLTRCDHDRTPAYLEATSPRNRRLYLRHGFRVTGEIPLPDGPTMWRMWRDPAGGANPTGRRRPG
jgi:GNAT superfamily N-acetyltransferase